MRRLAVFVLIIGGLCGILFWLNLDSPPPAARTLMIVTTVEPLESITSMMAGAQHRLYRLRAESLSDADRRTTKEADLILLNGFGLVNEPAEQITQHKRQNAPVLRIGEEAVPENERLRGNGAPNPYAWTSPRYGSAYAEKITAALVRLDPSGREQYIQRLELFQKRMTQLDEAIQQSLSDMSDSDRAQVALPQQMDYFARDYGLTVRDDTEGESEFNLPYYWDSLPGQPATRERSYFNLIVTNALTAIQTAGGDGRALKKVDVRALEEWSPQQ